MALTPSERVRIISEIADRLSDDSWPTIDMTLRQFNLPTTDVWQGDNRHAYVLKMVEDGRDDALLELGLLLGYELDLSLPPDAIPSCWEDGHSVSLYRICGSTGRSLAKSNPSCFTSAFLRSATRT